MSSVDGEEYKAMKTLKNGRKRGDGADGRMRWDYTLALISQEI